MKTNKLDKNVMLICDAFLTEQIDNDHRLMPRTRVTIVNSDTGLEIFYGECKIASVEVRNGRIQVLGWHDDPKKPEIRKRPDSIDVGPAETQADVIVTVKGGVADVETRDQDGSISIDIEDQDGA